MVISPSNNGVVMAWLHFRFDKTIRRDREPATAQLQGGVRCAQTPRHNAHYIEREIERIADQKQKLLLADRNQLGVAGSNCCCAARRAIKGISPKMLYCGKVSSTRLPRRISTSPL